MSRAIKFALGLIDQCLCCGCLCVGLILALTSPVGAQQPVKIEAEGEGLWRLTTTLMGEANRLEWAAQMEQRPEIEWQNKRGFIEIQWVVRSDDPPNLSTWRLMRSVGGQTEPIALTVDPALKVIGPVDAGMTLWRIGSEWLAAWDAEPAPVDTGDAGRSPPSMPQWLNQIMQANPQAFETQQPNSLMRGAMLRHPIRRAMADAPPPQAVAAEGSPSPEWRLSQAESAVPIDEDAVNPDEETQDTETQDTETQDTETQEALGLGEWILDQSTPKESSLDKSTAEESVALPVAQPRWFTFDFIEQPQWWQQPQQLGRVVLAVGLVVMGVMILQIFSHVGGLGHPGEEGLMSASLAADTRPTGMSPEAVSMTLDLAERYVELGEATQALHWIDEVLAYGSPKQIREAKRLKRDALAALNPGHE